MIDLSCCVGDVNSLTRTCTLFLIKSDHIFSILNYHIAPNWYLNDNDDLFNFKNVTAPLIFEVASIICSALVQVGRFLSPNQLKIKFHYLFVKES